MIHEDKKRLVILISIVGIFLLLLAVLLLIFFPRSSGYEGAIRINNYDSYVKNLPSSERNAMEATLYETVSQNLDNGTNVHTVSDAIIRNESYSQSFDKKIYTTSFIIDIESIKQSYEIKNVYSRLSVEESGLHDYTSLVLCLDKAKLIYGEFTCKDRLSQEAGIEYSDPILKYLPQSTLDYTLTMDSTSKNLHLVAKLNLTEVDYKIGVEDAVNQYKLELKDWFISKGLDINNYAITYEY